MLDRFLSQRRARQMHRILRNGKLTLLCLVLTIVVLRGNLGAGKFGTPKEDLKEIRETFSFIRRRAEPRRVLEEVQMITTARKVAGESKANNNYAEFDIKKIFVDEDDGVNNCCSHSFHSTTLYLAPPSFPSSLFTCQFTRQVTLALAVAEAAYEFEHRDLHWGNILVRRGVSENLCFTLEGRKILVKTFGLSISIIDFTLSRLKTGDGILFLDLSSDPAIFEGPEGQIQFDTYMKMREVTTDCWEGSYPKRNILWLEYLIHILMVSKKYKKSRHERKHLKDFKNRLSDYNSAKEGHFQLLKGYS